MKVAIIGTGFIAETHAQALKELGHNLITVVNSNLKKGEKFAKKWNVKHFGTSIDLAIDQADCVHICTPPTSHYEIAHAALLQGKHLICEKPLCLNPTQAKELSILAKEKNLVAAVNFNIRFHEASQRAKEIISAKDFGAIYLIHGTYLQSFHALPSTYNWRYNPKQGGQLRATTEIGSHWIDLARFWTGLEIKAVSANFGNFNPDRFITDDGLMSSKKRKNSKKINVLNEDAAIISLKFSNGAIGNVVLSEVSLGRNNHLSIEVTSSKKNIWWINEDPYKLHIGQKNKGINTQIHSFNGGFIETFKSFFNAVYFDVQKGFPSKHANYPTFEDGFINAQICTAIYESAINNSIWTEIKI